MLLTDGVATAGATDPAALKAAVRALGALGVERLDVLAAGALRDDALLRELVQGNLPHDGAVIGADAADRGDRPPADAGLPRQGSRWRCRARPGCGRRTWTASSRATRRWSTPTSPEGKKLEVRLDGKKVALAGEIAPAERPLLERQWVAARIDRLQHLRAAGNAGDEDLRRALALQITELSIRHRVLSPLTAFLVLETAADYERYGLDRKSPGRHPDGRRRRARGAGPHPAADRDSGDGGTEADWRSTGSASPMAGKLWRGRPKIRPPMRPLPVRNDRRQRPGRAGRGRRRDRRGAGWSSRRHRRRRYAAASPPPSAPALRRVAQGAGGDAPLRVGGRAGGEELEERTVSRESAASDLRLASPEVAPAEPSRDELAKLDQATPYEGRFAEVMALLAKGDRKAARQEADSWRRERRATCLALLALGEAAEAAGDKTEAARAYGSLIDLYPSRADLRRYAGEELERLGKESLALAADTYAKAVADRPDHASGHRLLAWALAGLGRFEEAFAALETRARPGVPGRAASPRSKG